ncbi:MAG TPA: PAS domain S-box protein [Flavisolibacter sp.]
MAASSNRVDRESDLHLSSDLLADHPLPTWIINSDNRIIRYANKAARQLSDADPVGQPLTGFLTPDSSNIFLDRYATGIAVDGIYQLASGKTIELFSAQFEIENTTLLQVSAVDITSRSAAQQQLEDDRRRYRAYIENSSEGIFCQEFINPVPVDLDIEELITHCRKNSYVSECNDAMAVMYGYEKAEELRGALTEQLIHFDDPANIQYLTNFFSNGFRIVNAESHEKDRNGNSKYFLNNAVGIIEDGMLKRVWGSQRDITEAKEAESRLKESEDRFREVADSAPVMIWMSDENNNIVYLNKKWVDFTGKNVNEFGPRGWMSLVHMADLKKAKESYDAAFRQREQIVLVYRLKHRDGTYKFVHDVSVPRFLGDGTFVGYIGSLVDIEDQKQKEKQLLYQATILENVSDIIITTDLGFRIRNWNKVAEKVYNLNEQEAMGRLMNEIIQFEYSGTTLEQALVDLHRDGIWKGEVRFTDDKGKERYFLHTVKYICDEAGHNIGFLDVGRDITDRKKIEQKLLKSEEFYRALFADSLDGILLMNEEGIITFSSPSVSRVLGYGVDEILGRNAFDFVHNEDLSWAFESFRREVSENPEIKFIVVRLLKKNGDWLWCNVRGHNMLDNPAVNRIVVYFHDDTLRKQAREALKESEERFRSLIRDLQTGVFLADQEGNIIMCNRALGQMLSIPEDVVVGKNVYDIMSNDMIDETGHQVPREKRPLTQTLKHKITVKDRVVGVLHPVTRERCWIMVNSNPIMDAQGNIRHVVCSVMDITERKKIEQKLITGQLNHQRQLTQATIDGQEKERREIGKELHDNIGQQLTTIKLFLDMAKTSADMQGVEMISLAVKGVNDVINEIRSISRNLVPHTLKDLGLVDSVSELVESISRMQLLNIEFQSTGFDETYLQENQKLTLFRIIQEQLNNIVKHSEASNILLRLRSNPTEVMLDIRDDGQGFDPKVMRKGLGFANIQNRVELFGGRSEIRSKPGNGCVLKVIMPLTVD